MNCEFCNGKTKKKKVKRQHWIDEKLYIVENVEAEVCSECGERYYHAEVLDRIDNFVRNEHPVKDKMEVEIIALDKAG